MILTASDCLRYKPERGPCEMIVSAAGCTTTKIMAGAEPLNDEGIPPHREAQR